MSSSSFPRFRRLFAPRPSSRLRTADRRRSRPGLELMEDRQLLSTLTVMNAGDNGDNVHPLAGSLRAAILQADAAPAGTYSTINFNLGGSGLHTIALKAALPAITTPVNLNGMSESGYQGKPLIELDGSQAGPAALGLVLAQSASGTAARSTQVNGLEINAFAGGGVSVTASYVQLTSDAVGLTQTTGGFIDLVKANRMVGVQFLGGASHDLLSRSLVAGTLQSAVTGGPGQGVVITGAGSSYDTIDNDFVGTIAPGNGSPRTDINGASLGNTGDGVMIEAGANHNTVSNSAICNNLESGIELIGLGTSFNTVSGDNIGTSGDSILPNYNGVTITSGASSNTIGGTTAAARNVISDNKSNGVIFTFGDFNISSGPSNNLVEGNDIGVGPGDTAAVPNFSGVTLENGTTSNTIGGTTAGAANVISGNYYDGIVIGTTGVSKNLVEGNEVGTDATGTIAQPNGHDGIDILGGANLNTVGGTTAGARNVISGNANDGVGIAYAGTSNNLVEGNFIGTNAAGTAPLPNGADGLQISGGATGNTVGGITAGARNVISGNANHGVSIMDQGTSNNLVEGNDIGTGVNGTSALPNGEGVALASGAAGNTVGGTTAAARNLISGNATWGVYISDPGTSNNAVEGDDIGTDTTGTTALPNGSNGVNIVSGASSNTVGGTTAGARNVISGNAYAGVVIAFAGASNNLIEGDYIGTNAAGTAALPNGADGVQISGGATGNTVGGTSSAARNILSGNAGGGVTITDPGTSNNLVAGDYVGTDVTGTMALPNGEDGVDILEASTNTVGGTTAAARDLISGNARDGILISGLWAWNNLVAGDYVGTDVTGTRALPNGNYGVGIGASSNTIGGTTAGAHDVISGNAVIGVVLAGDGTTGNVVAGDYIGTDATGSDSLGNRSEGVGVFAGASNNLIGGTTAGARNVISGNGQDGVLIGADSTTGNVVAGDYVGTDAIGTRALPNGSNGIEIVSGSSNTIGGTTAGARDVVSGNAVNGIVISGNIFEGMSIPNVSGVASNNVVEGDYIGTNAAGTAALPNGGDGVQIIGGAAGNTVGGTTFDDCDVISGNAGNGVTVSDTGTNNNTIQADYIGTGTTGELPVPNSNNGVSVQNGAYGNNVVYDLISANVGCGVLVTGSTTSVTSVNYDRIGLDAIGTMIVKQPGLAYSNHWGVLFAAGANGDSASSDVISGNKIGVQLSTGATGNYINNDKIGTDIYGTGNAGNIADGIYLVGVVNNQMVNDLICYNGDVGILGTNGSSDQNNTIFGDFFTVTVCGVTYGNTHGATLFD